MATGLTLKRCLLTTVQIRDCEVYHAVTGGYECYQCSSNANIDMYTFILNGVLAARCLNTVTEYVYYCSTYQFAS